MVGSAAVPGAPGPHLPPVTLADACGPTQREGFENCGVALVSGLRFIKLVDNLETRFPAWTEKCQGFCLPAAGGRAGTKKSLPRLLITFLQIKAGWKRLRMFFTVLSSQFTTTETGRSSDS